MKEVIDKLVFIKFKALQKMVSRKWEDKPQIGRKCLQKSQLIKDDIQNIQRSLKTQQ